MANIDEYIKQIQQAQYGGEVRGSIVNALKKVNDDNNSYVAIKKEVVAAKDIVEEKAEIFDEKANAAKETLTALQASTQIANEAKSSLNNIISSAISTKKELEQAVLETGEVIARVDNAKSNLDKSITSAGKAELNLQRQIETSNQIKNQLDVSNNTAIELKKNLDVAINEANTAKVKLVEAINNAGNAALEKIETAQSVATRAVETAKVEAVKAITTAGTTETKRVTDEGTKQVQTVQSMGTQETEKVTAEGTKQVTLVKTEGEKHLAEVQTAAQEIVADREQIQENKTSIAKLKEDLVDIYNSDKFNVVKLKNGFDVTKIKKGYRLDQSTGLEEAAENNTLFYEYIKIKPDIDYSVWENKTTNKMEKVDIVRSNLRVCFYDSLKRILKSNSDENVFHSPQDARYARISMNHYFAGYSIFKEGTEKPENIIIPFTEELSLNEKVHIQKVEEAEKKIEENAKNLKSVTLNEEITGIGNIITKPAVEMQVLDFTVRGETKLTHTDATPDKIATLTEFEDLTIRVNEKEYKFLDVNANGRDNVFDEIKSGKIIRRFVSITLDGNESLNHTTLSNGQEAFGLRVGNHRLKPQGIAMCTHYTGAPYYRRNYDIYIPNENWIYVCDNRFKTEEAAKNYYKEQYAKGNPVKIILPIEEEIEHNDKIGFKTEEGVNTITCNSPLSFTVKYALDVSLALESQKANIGNNKKAFIKTEAVRDKKKKLLALESFCQNFSIEEKVSAPVYAVSRTVDAENCQFLFESLDGGETWDEIGKLDVDVKNGEIITCIYIEPLEQTLYAIKKAGNRRPKEYELISYDISTPDFRKIGTLDIGKKYAHAASHNFDSAYQNGTYHPYTIFAEYGTGNDEEMYVWKTKNKGATWEKVFVKGARGGNGEIKHFHCVQIDPFTKEIWLASGDTDSEAKIWKSTDEGETWMELYSGSQHNRTLGFVFEKDAIYYGMDSPTSAFPSNIYKIDRNTNERKSVGVTKNGWAVYNLTRTFLPKGFLIFTEYERANDSAYGNKYCIEFYNYDTAKMEVVAEFDISNSEDDYIGIMVAPRYQDMFSGKILLNPTPGLYNQYTGYVKNTYAPMWSLNLNV